MKRGQLIQFIITSLIILFILITPSSISVKKPDFCDTKNIIDTIDKNIPGAKKAFESQNEIIKNLQTKRLDLIEENLPNIKNNPERLSNTAVDLGNMLKQDPTNQRISNNLNIVRKELNKFLIPKPNEIMGINEGDLLHGTTQNGLVGILNSGYIKTSKGDFGEGVYFAEVLKDPTAAIGITRRVKTGEIPILFRIKKEGLYIKLDIPYQGRVLDDVPLKSIEIYDPVKKQWLRLEYTKKNQEKFEYLF